ncbi:HTTM domain-containing protein [Streptomyces bambusae]|uniref:HTTM domain-containing protein n=1 Tax=Streptomyces bambusae TaxID=1550616 RepID=UPI001CFD8CBD|nr:HTTM domain-containing protein [Streptomyces bambusae]MCB5163372.1 HTTM domain-containing protein [Streptomyces bambusae]
MSTRPADATVPADTDTDTDTAPVARTVAAARAALGRGVGKVTGRALGPYQSAVIRIGFAGTWLLFLLRELPHRRELYGPDGPWSFELAERLIASNNAFTVLLWGRSGLWFELVYLMAVVSAALLALGWRTRATSVFFMIGVLSLQNRSVFMGDGGDNVIHLMALYLVLTRCAQVWSLDARRAAREAAEGRRGRDVAGPVLWAVLGVVLVVTAQKGATSGTLTVLFAALWAGHALWWFAERTDPRGEARALFDVIGNVVHNAAMFVIMAEVCLIYATAGWYKIQGSRWQDGTALYYPLNLDYFAPWPALSDLLGGSAVLVLLLSYGTVAVQVAFPFTLFNRRVKNVLLAVMMLEHAGIAVVLGLPFFSLAMIAADAVFLPTAFLVWTGARAGSAFRRLRPRTPAPRTPPAPAGTGPLEGLEPPPVSAAPAQGRG